LAGKGGEKGKKRVEKCGGKKREKWGGGGGGGRVEVRNEWEEMEAKKEENAGWKRVKWKECVKDGKGDQIGIRNQTGKIKYWNGELRREGV